MTQISRPRAVMYVDGFNLYYGALKKTKFKWLNLFRLAQLVYPNFDFVAVHYCSAKVSARPNNPAQPQRQELYLRALATVPEIGITLGNFMESHPRMRVHPSEQPPSSIKVIKYEEKGSDVNLATHLLCDAYEDKFDIAVVITNDSDLVMPIQEVRSRLGKKVFLLNPQKEKKKRSRHLHKNVDDFRPLRVGVLEKAQFPATLSDAHGTFHKPPNW